ncbi:low temperature requirement protein A [Hamadaea tsunoensis]|uniref:low temperature requirement protein A n=1 Tax=Hamadaea tsunoensis TaxID=53368 RepID=UPI000488459F|nr:low temperature requirement protein A [Hamadaea tsunoensis]
MTIPSVDESPAEESPAEESAADGSPARTAAEERHATWLELFFDLVIVAAVAQLAHLLHEDVGPREIFLFAILYYAMWSVWTSFTLYANVRGERTLQWTVLTAMFGIAVMAASIPQFAEGGAGYKYFVLAYIACRFLAVKSWQRASAVMAEWPAAQQFVPVIPWVSSLWDGGVGMHWHYFQWGLGIVLDIAFAVGLSRRPDKMLKDAQKEREQERRRWTRRFANRRGPQPVVPQLPDMQIVHADRSHLGERLGLFVIIVLGEAVAQVVNSAAGADWHWPLALAGFSGFGLLVCIWYLTLQYGASAVPNATTRTYGLPLTLPTHYLMTASVVVIAAGLGTLAAHPDGELSTAHRWVLCAGAAVYFLTASFIGARTGAPLRWMLGWGVPSVTVTLLLGVFGGPLPGWGVSGVLVLVAVWHILYRRDVRAARVRAAVPRQG